MVSDDASRGMHDSDDALEREPLIALQIENRSERAR
jgi:hypothetical protein